jgi:hypothetical protein
LSFEVGDRNADVADPEKMIRDLAKALGLMPPSFVLRRGGSGLDKTDRCSESNVIAQHPLPESISSVETTTDVGDGNADGADARRLGGMSTHRFKSFAAIYGLCSAFQ